MTEPLLSEADVRAGRNGLYELNQAREIIDRLKKCGLECGEEDARCQHATGFLTAVLSEFGPAPSKKSGRGS